MRGKSIFKQEPLETNFITIFLKQKQLFRIVATYFSISFIHLMETDFASSRNSVFFGKNYFAASRNHYWNQQKIVLKERGYSCQWTADFLGCEKHCFCIFHRLLPVIVFYRLVKTFFLTKSLVPASANGFSGQQKPLSFVQRYFLLVKRSLKLVKTNFERNT